MFQQIVTNSNNNTAPEPFDLTESHNCKYQPYRIKLQLIVKLSTLRTPLIKTQHRGQEAQTPKYQGSTSKLEHGANQGTRNLENKNIKQTEEHKERKKKKINSKNNNNGENRNENRLPVRSTK